ncbi:MAG: flavodoxin family protein [Deltaproteobacteria bacterium]|nr:flavodoxin family protein [bacterium]MCB9475464.1 flavodoxin family protein [Deltaproteobacteria bacterium]MCB9488533.1 flavodoxin family protein [Deltaproteobacteria bacterium]
MTHVIAVAGSPREGANTDRLLDAFLDGVREAGASVERVTIREADVGPCRDCGPCEIAGSCVIADDHPALAVRVLEADIFVLASPVYYCGFPGMTKNFIDRFQPYWYGRYKKNLPPRTGPDGYFLSVGAAPSLKNFDGMRVTFKYLMRSVWGEPCGELVVPATEERGAVAADTASLEQARRLGYEAVMQRQRASDEAPGR